MCIRGQELNPTKIQGPSISVKFLGVQWCGACRDILSKVKGMFLTPGSYHHKEKSTTFNGSIWILEMAHSSLGCVIQDHTPRDSESCLLCVDSGTGEGSSSGPGHCAGYCSTRTISSSRPDGSWGVSGKRSLQDFGGSLYHHLHTTILPLNNSCWPAIGP